MKFKSKKNYTSSKRVLPKVAENKKTKNVRFMKRGKQMVEFQRKQQILEEKYREKNHGNVEENSKPVVEKEVEPAFAFKELLFDLKETSKNNCNENNVNENLTEHVSKMPNITSANHPLDESNAHNHAENEDFRLSSAGTEAYCNTDADNDVFSLHLDYDFSNDEVPELTSYHEKSEKLLLQWTASHNLIVEYLTLKNRKFPDVIASLENFKVCASNMNEYNNMAIKPMLLRNIHRTFTTLQSEMFSILNNYQDFYYPNQSYCESGDIRFIYCLHALNHALKTRLRIISHNTKLKLNKKDGFLIPDNYRDQGITRPKILVIVPFRNSVVQIVNTMAGLLYGFGDETWKTNGAVMNYTRFLDDYTRNTLHFPKINKKPEDYEHIFAGNIDDNFRIGISVTRKCLKLYTDFYSSDIIIASPLGLRLTIGAAGSNEQDYDFLSSIEFLVIDQGELILAQNWENLLYVLDCMHLQPRTLRDTDIQRVRSWCLNGLSRFYRQTLLLSSHDLPEFRALFNNKCWNYRGKIRSSKPVAHGDIRNVIPSLSQFFLRVPESTIDLVFETRFNFFVNEVLPRFKTSSYAHSLIYIPSYFDYVRLRNYFKSETLSFVQICEYSKKEKIARARDMFFHSGAHFMLYSERSHFFRRTRIKGIRHLIMYQPPTWPNFYSELVNLMHENYQNQQDGLQNSMSVTVVYSKYDSLKLSSLLGTKSSVKLLKSSRDSYAFTTTTKF